MLTFELQNHDSDQYVVITPKTFATGHFPKEESTQFLLRDFDGYQSDYTYSQAITLRNAYNNDNNKEAGLIPINSFWSATDYIGAATYKIPYHINFNFINVKFFNAVNNPLSSLNQSGSEEIGGLFEDLYTLEQIDEKNLVSLENGLQAIRIPAHKFDELLTDPDEIANNNGEEYRGNFGKYYLSITPKYIQTVITDYKRHNHVNWLTWQENPNLPWDGRRSIIEFDRNSLLNTPWAFEDSPNPGLSIQRGRLFGSIVEVWDPTLTRLKVVKLCGENAYGFDSPVSNAALVLYPDTVGFDPANDLPTAGDIMRIYPRETYFLPIHVEINYTNTASMEAALRFLKNDMVRNLETNVIEVYDDNGISIDSAGNISGVVVDAYQVFQLNNNEIRRRVKVN